MAAAPPATNEPLIEADPDVSAIARWLTGVR